MYSQGQLVTPSVDGSRPGYGGEWGRFEDTKYGSRIKYDTKLKKYIKIKQDRQGNTEKIYSKPNENVKKFLQRTGAKTFIPTPKEKQKIIKAFSNTKFNFKKYPAYGVKKYPITGNTNKTNPKYTEVTRFVDNDFKIAKGKYKDVILSVADQNKITDNFELPEGQEWNFRSKKNPGGYQFGVAATGQTGEKLARRIDRFLNQQDKYTLAADRSSAKGWMMNAMERVYNNETVLKNGKRVLKKGVDKLTYEPKFNNKGVIVGFTDNTAAGKNNTYYGLKKYEGEDSTNWRIHGDHDRIKKFLKIADGVKAEPDKLLQKILDDKGITKLMGDKSVLTLNDVLSHERYYSKLSSTAPKALIERQIVLHHTRGVGGGNLARAAATKDIQLLTGAINAEVDKLESIVRGTKKNPARALTIKEKAQLKNYGAKIVDFDGKVVGGGFRDPTRQYAAIKKDALKYARGKDFNVKTVASYLERLGCGGKAAGGRVLMSNGGPTLTKCANEGTKRLEQIILRGGANKTEQDLAKKYYKQVED